MKPPISNFARLRQSASRVWLVVMTAAAVGWIGSRLHAQAPTLRMTGIAPAGNGQVSVRWEGAAGPFRVQMSTNGGAHWSDCSPDVMTNEHRVAVDTRVAGAVLFRVRTVPDQTPPPPPPAVFGIAPSCREVRVAWWPVNDSGGSGLWGYKLYRDGALVTGVPVDGTFYVDTNCVPGRQYSYAVTAMDQAGNESSPSLPAHASTPECPITVPTLAGFIPGIGIANSVFASGGMAFVASQEFGLTQASLSDPTSPRVLGASDVPFHGAAVDVAGTVACVTGHRTFSDGSALLATAFGLYVLETGSGRPVMQGWLEGAGWTGQDVKLSGGRAYVACGSDGLRVVDVTTPSSPRVVGTLDTPGFAQAIALGGGLALVADGQAGVRILSLANPDVPVELAVVDTPGLAKGVALAGQRAYVADDTSLRVLDLTQPSAPVELGHIVMSAQRVTVRDGLAYVCASSQGLHIVNVTDPAQPQVLGSLPPAGNPNASTLNVALTGNYACLANREGGLAVADVSIPSVPLLNGTRMDWFQGVNIAARPGVAVVTGTAYAQGGAFATNGLRVVDLADPARPIVVGQLDTPTLALQGVDMAGSLAFVACGEAGLRVVDLTTPAQPSILGAYDTPGFAQGVCVSGSLALVADGVSGLRLLDVSIPASPRSVGFLDTPGTARDVTVSGSLAYVADGTSLQIIDVTVPASPVLRGSYGVAAQKVRVRGGLAYVAAASAGLVVLNVADPAAIGLVSTVPPTGHFNASTLGVALADGLVLTANREGGLSVFDTAAGGTPLLRQMLPLPGRSVALSVAGSWALLADGVATLDAVRFAP